MSSSTIPEVQDVLTGMKKKREETEDVHSLSKKVVTTRSSPPVQVVPGPSHDSTPSETWNPDETNFMEGPHLTHSVSKSKSRRGGMSVDTIRARLIRATSTLQILPSHQPDTAAGNSTVVIKACDTKSTRVEETADQVVYQKTLEGGVEPGPQKAASSALMFGIPAPFPVGTFGPGSAPERLDNSGKIAAYHGTDKFYSSRPPSSATPP